MRMEKWRKGKVNESWSGGEKNGVLVRMMGECENVENRWKCGAKVIDCELF